MKYEREYSEGNTPEREKSWLQGQGRWMENILVLCDQGIVREPLTSKVRASLRIETWLEEREERWEKANSLGDSWTPERIADFS
jgi:hypothetical protein